MYKSSAKFRQRFKEQYTVDLGAGKRQGVKKNNTGKKKSAISKSSNSPFELQRRRMPIIRNINNNKERLAKAEDALARQYANIYKLEKQIESAWSLEFKERAEIWLKESQAKVLDIKKSINKIKQWIEEDAKKLKILS